MENAVDQKTLNFLLQKERKEILNYVSRNMKEILHGFEKIDKICAINNEDGLSEKAEVISHSELSCMNVPVRTERFPTKISIALIPGKFPSFLNNGETTPENYDSD